MTARMLTAFVGDALLAQGGDATIREALRRHEAQGPSTTVLVFDDATGRQTDVDMRESVPHSAPGADEASPPRRGRPKLGVTPREVTLLPRHWDWLAKQPGGASVALRKLVESAARGDSGPADRRAAKDAAYHFLSAKAGDYPRFEEAIRALYASDKSGFETAISDWPEAVRAYTGRLAEPGWDAEA